FRVTTGLHQMGNVEIALLRVRMHMRLRNIAEARLAQKTLDCLFRSLGRRPLDLLAHVLGTGGEIADVERQAAWRPVLARRLVGQASLNQTIRDELFQVGCSLTLHSRGDFFAAQFKKKIGHWTPLDQFLCRDAGSPPENSACQAASKFAPPASVSRKASPHALASSRTRRM